MIAEVFPFSAVFFLHHLCVLLILNHPKYLYESIIEKTLSYIYKLSIIVIFNIIYFHMISFFSII